LRQINRQFGEKMKESVLTVEKNHKIAKDTYRMRLSGDVGVHAPGQFVELTAPGFYLRRPFGVFDSSEDYLEIVYKVVGKGTAAMSDYPLGTELSALLSLGNSFDMSKAKKPLLISGGLGAAPLHFLAKKFFEAGVRSTIVAGFRNNEEVALLEELQKFGEVTLATDDGSAGFCGNTVCCLESLKTDFDFYYACGPQVMLAALAKKHENGEISMEARMGCGFGACMGCTIKTTNGFKRVCKEGPVFSAKEVIF